MKDVVVAAAPEQQVVHADVALVGGDGVVVVVHADAPLVAAVNCSEHFVTIELELVVAVVGPAVNGVANFEALHVAVVASMPVA